MTSALYNEIDPFASAWLANLVAGGYVAPGRVDTRSIVDLTPQDCDGIQAHFFAGIGVWSYALRLAGWPDDLGVWTGSCPCQPFSVAGKGKGVDDARHLWPDWFKLIDECQPTAVFGEQVAGGAGRAWLASVRSDLEGAGYAVAAADLCAAGAGAPHIRQRLYWVAYRPDRELRDRLTEARGQSEGTAGGHRIPDGLADLHGVTRGQGSQDRSGCDYRGSAEPRAGLGSGGEPCGVGQPDRDGREPGQPTAAPVGYGRSADAAGCDDSWLGDADGIGSAPGLSGPITGNEGNTTQSDDGSDRRAAPPRSYWSDAVYLPCLDGKARPTQPGLHPLAYGTPARVGRLRGYGNAIVAPLAATFIRSAMTAILDTSAETRPHKVSK